MDIKQTFVLEIEKNDFKFQFVMPVGATWGSALDAAYDASIQIGKLSEEYAQKLKQSSVPKEETPAE